MMFFSCSQKNQPTNEGYIECSNVSKDQYFVDISGITAVSFVLDAHKTKKVTVTPGSYTITVKQQNGYMFYPTKETDTHFVQKGQTWVFSFPMN